MKNNKTFSEILLESMDEVLREKYNTSLSEINVQCRERDLVILRYTCIALFHDYTGDSTSQLSRRFDRNRSTIYHALRSAEDMKEYDRQFYYDYMNFKELLDVKLEEKKGRIVSDRTPEVGEAYYTIDMRNGRLIPATRIWEDSEADHELEGRRLIFFDKIYAETFCGRGNTLLGSIKR